jgi:MFS family permease
VGIFLTYNVLAFLTQPLTGLLADHMARKHWLLLASVLLLTMAVLATSVVMALGTSAFGIMLVAVLLGMGNSLFHVWGGKQVAVKTNNDMRALGVFVSTGAFGLAIGFVFFSWPLLYVFLLLICLLAVGVVQEPEGSSQESEDERQETRSWSQLFVILAVVGLMVAVMLRSFVGEAFSSGITKSSMMVLLIGGLSMLGKMAGGWIARQMGIVKMLVMVLLVVMACYLFKDHGLVILLVGLFAVNCTMPVTLYLVNLVLPGKEGLAFGLLAAALIPGYILATI